MRPIRMCDMRGVEKRATFGFEVVRGRKAIDHLGKLESLLLQRAQLLAA